MTTEELITLWVDGELPETERQKLEQAFADDPQLKAEAEGQRASREAVGGAFAAGEKMPHGDFFQSQLLRRIEREAEAATPAASAPAESAWWRRLFMPAAFAGMAACFFLGFVIAPSADRAGPDAASFAATVYSPDGDVTAEVVVDEEATVIVLSGLEAIPDAVDIAADGTFTPAANAEPATVIATVPAGVR